MKKEIAAVVTFLSRLIKNNENLNKEEIERFSDELTRLLYAKFANHWYPATPTKGQAYRCIRVNKFQGVDPDLLSACMNSGLVYEDLGLPKEFTLWVDPWEVCCRYGEKNHAFIVASIESDYNDKEVISERESYVVDKVTSDYHSGSSSDDEIYTSNQKVLPISLVTNTSQNYQVQEMMLQSVPLWNKYPKRKQLSHFHYHPRFLPGYQQHGRVLKAILTDPNKGLYCVSIRKTLFPFIKGGRVFPFTDTDNIFSVQSTDWL